MTVVCLLIHVNVNVTKAQSLYLYLVTAFQQLGNLFTPGNSVISSGPLLNAKMTFPFAMALILDLR